VARRCALADRDASASVLFTGISRVMLSLNARSALNHPDEAANLKCCGLTGVDTVYKGAYRITFTKKRANLYFG